MTNLITDIGESEWQAYVSLASDFVRSRAAEPNVALYYRALFDAATIFLRGGNRFDDEVVSSMNELRSRGIEAASDAGVLLDVGAQAVNMACDASYWRRAQVVVLPKLRHLHPTVQARKVSRTLVADIVSGAIYLDWSKAHLG